MIRSKARRRLKDFIPSNARFLLTDIFGKSDKVFTEQDLTSNEMQYLKDNISNIISGGRFVNDERIAIQPGGGYDDTMMDESNLLNLVKKSYDPKLSLRTTLGNATLDLSGGQAVIRDKYDFTYEPKQYGDMSLKEIINADLGAYDFVSAIAGKFASNSKANEGKPVAINLGTLEDLGLTPDVLKGLQEEASESLLTTRKLIEDSFDKMMELELRKRIKNKPNVRGFSKHTRLQKEMQRAKEMMERALRENPEERASLEDLIGLNFRTEHRP